MPELGRVSREEAAALAGLAPFDNDSGQYRVVGIDQQLSRAGDEGCIVSLSCSGQTCVERDEGLVLAECRRESGGKQGSAKACSTAGDTTLTSRWLLASEFIG